MAELDYAPTFADASLDAPSFHVEEMPQASMLELRTDDASTRVEDMVAEVLDVRPLAEPLSAASSDTWDALWLRPGGWLLVGPPADGRIGDLRPALATSGAILVDVSHRSVRLRLSGDRTRNVLAAVTPLDIRPKSFPPARCARTVLLGLAVLLHRRPNLDSYDLYADRSIVHAVWSGLAKLAKQG